MKKMSIGVRIFFILLSLIASAVAFYITALFESIVTAIIIAVIGIFLILCATLIPKKSKSRVMVLPLIIGILLTIVPVGKYTIITIAVLKEHNKNNNEVEETKVPPTYVYTEHNVGSPDSSPITKAEYYERYETVDSAHSLKTGPYIGAQRNPIEYKPAHPRQQTGRFDESINPNYHLDVETVKKYNAASNRVHFAFDIRSVIGMNELDDTSLLENMFVDTNTYLTVYPYGELSFVMEYYKDITTDGMNIRVSQYIYLNDYGYLEREEYLWSATCDDAYSSTFIDQLIIVYEYIHKVTTEK